MVRQSHDENQAGRQSGEDGRSRRHQLLECIRIQRAYMKRDAEELTRTLNLPDEMVYDVLAALYRQSEKGGEDSLAHIEIYK